MNSKADANVDANTIVNTNDNVDSDLNTITHRNLSNSNIDDGDFKPDNKESDEIQNELKCQYHPDLKLAKHFNRTEKKY